MPEVQYDFFVQWHLTERCNLSCRHCYQRAAAAAELDASEISQAIDNIKGTIDGWVSDYELVMSPGLHFTGGEPLLRKDLFAILDYARSAGFRTSLLTNGTLITRERARRLKESQVANVQVSLDGLETVHDRIRGRGSFRRAVSGIDNLVSQEVSTHINLTLSRLNIGELEGLAELVASLGLDRVTYSRLVTCGSGQCLAPEMLSPAELAELHARLKKRGSVSGTSITSRDPLALVSELKGDVPEADFPIGGCAAGVFGVTITSDGGIMPCRRMDLTIGNIRTDSFRRLWVESPVLTGLRRRDAYHGGCDSCDYWAVCRGCRAIALAASRGQGGGDFLGPDPQCPYRKPREPRLIVR